MSKISYRQESKRSLSHKTLSALVIFCIFAASPTIAQDFLKYKINHYSQAAQKLLGDAGENNLYKLNFKDVSNYLPETHKLKRRDLLLIAKRILPGKSFIKLARYFTYHNKQYSKMYSPKDFFAGLHEGMPHTYVVLKDRFIFTETTAKPQKERNKDRLSKHYFISGLQSKVNYAGEFIPYVDHSNGHLFLVFDNGSGTFQPDKKHLPQLKLLLEHNFDLHNKGSEDNQIHIITKSFDQKVVQEKLFAFQAEPFIEEGVPKD